MTAADIQAIRNALAAGLVSAPAGTFTENAMRTYAFVVACTPERIARLLAELGRLRAICLSAHDRLLRGDDDRELLALLATAWEAQATAAQSPPAVP